MKVSEFLSKLDFMLLSFHKMVSEKWLILMRRKLNGLFHKGHPVWQLTG